MAEDRYTVIGGYAEATPGALTLQAEYWRTDHRATRDVDAVAAVLASAQPWEADHLTDANGAVVESVDYAVQTAYVRAGYAVGVGKQASVVPYVQGDWYSNPEIVNDKDLGGDAEAGLADDGQFLKGTAGCVIRPVPEIALKLDGSAHVIQFNGATEVYPEARVSFSYLWQVKP